MPHHCIQLLCTPLYMFIMFMLGDLCTFIPANHLMNFHSNDYVRKSPVITHWRPITDFYPISFSHDPNTWPHELITYCHSKKKVDWMKLVREYPQHSILCLDLRNSQMAFGGLLETASEAPESMVKRMDKQGLWKVLCTDISKDWT